MGTSSSAVSMDVSDLKEALVGSSGMVSNIQNKHDPPKHQHSAASLLSSVAKASEAIFSMDSTTSSASIPIIPGAVAATTCTGLGTSPPVTSSGAVTATEAPTPTVGAVASATVSMIPNTSTITNPSTGTTGCTITTAEMETKCTQTKLDDELEPPLILQTTSSTTSESIIKPIIPVTTSGVEPNCGSRSGSISVVGPPKSGSIINEAGVPNIAATNVATEPVVTNEGAGSNP